MIYNRILFNMFFSESAENGEYLPLWSPMILQYVYGIKTCARGVCLYNTPGHVRAESLNPEPVGSSIGVLFPGSIRTTPTTNPVRSVLITIKAWHLLIANNLHLKKANWCIKRESFNVMLPL